MSLWLLVFNATAQSEETENEKLSALERITVTARKVQEDPLQLPFSLNLLSRAELDAERMYGLESVLFQVPGVEAMSMGDPASTTVRIRGVGALSGVSQDDSSVAIHLDGVPLSIGNSTLSTLDVARVEVLKGPQSTITGRNSEAGVINIYSTEADFTTSGYARAELGDDNLHLLEGAFGTALNDDLALRVALRHRQVDSHVYNANDHQPLSKPEELAGRLKLRWLASERTEVKFNYASEALQGWAALFALRPYDWPAQMAVTPGSSIGEQDSEQFSLVINHQFDHWQLTSHSSLVNRDYISGYELYEGLLYDKLLGMRPESYFKLIIDERRLNQELRFSSVPGSQTFWLAGVQLSDTRRHNYFRDSWDKLNPASPYNADMDRSNRGDSQALFAELTQPLTDKLHLTAGLRYTWEEKEVDSDWRAGSSNPTQTRQALARSTLSDNFLTGRLAVSYLASDNLNLYGNYGKGHKAGGYADLSTDFINGLQERPYRATSIDSLELGGKYRSPDGRLAWQAAAFFSDTTDDHVQVYDLQTFMMVPVNYDTRSRGAELGVDWQWSDGVKMELAATYVDAEITHVPADLNDGAKAGNRFPNSPRFSGFAALTHDYDLNAFQGLSFSTRLSYRFVGNRSVNPSQSMIMPAYQLVNLRLSLGWADSQLYLFAHNLFDKVYDTYAYYYPPFYAGGEDASIGTPGRGRQVGVGLNYVF